MKNSNDFLETFSLSNWQFFFVVRWKHYINTFIKGWKLEQRSFPQKLDSIVSLGSRSNYICDCLNLAFKTNEPQREKSTESGVWDHDTNSSTNMAAWSWWIYNFPSVNTFILKLRMHKQMISNVSFGYTILNWKVWAIMSQLDLKDFSIQLMDQTRHFVFDYLFSSYVLSTV